MAADKMNALAALHNPDMVVGGKDVIDDFGDRNVNLRIGAQWKKGKPTRLEELDAAAKAIPESDRAATQMNARLQRCKCGMDMDEDFEGFLEDMGPAFDRQYAPKSSIDRYRGKLPDQLLKYWHEYGWCGYADGLFWTVNPQDYEPVLDAWIGDTPFMEKDAYHVIARSAFGDLYFWGEKTGFTLLISTIGSFAVPRSGPIASLEKHIQWFFGSRDRKENDFGDYFAPALKKFGRLKADEMYGFVPALALGGSDEFDRLEKLKAIEHLVFLAQLSELRVMVTHPR